MREYNEIEGVNCKTGASVNIRPVIGSLAIGKKQTRSNCK